LSHRRVHASVKPWLARLLADFHLQEARSVAAFDLNVGERTLAQFLPEKTSVATIRDINGQMVLCDRLVAKCSDPRSIATSIRWPVEVR